MKIKKLTDDNSSRVKQLINKGIDAWNYCAADVWNDSRKSWKVNLVKTANLSVRSFLNQDLQSRACALTFRTILAIVPALALFCAIGRGFGLQEMIQDELISYFPSQSAVLEQAFGFVDSYLKEASGGLFVGIGIVFLLWTLISLLSNVENLFNDIWQIETNRRLWTKVTDYLAIFLILPVTMICAGGLSLFMSTSLKTLLPFEFLDSAIKVVLDFLSIALSWLFFAGTYMLIPNTKVKPLPALISGIVVGSAYQVLQWLFVSGQLYVAKYNAIYGSFSFLPLMLIWLQLVWLITLIGAVVCFASQNISEFNFEKKVKNISEKYFMQATLVIMAIVGRRFIDGVSPLTTMEISQQFNIPINLAKPIVEKLHTAGLVNYLHRDDNDITLLPLQPAVDMRCLTVGNVINRMYTLGDSEFIPELNNKHSQLASISNRISDEMIKSANILLIDTIDVSQ